MGDYLPPAGPPPPKVPPGWKAVWNDQYKEWFYVNTYTKASTWERPTEPAHGPGNNDLPPDGPPPAYRSDGSHPPPEKGGFAHNNPYGNAESDEAMARRLQEEENRRAQGQGSSTKQRGEADSFYAGGPTQQYGASSGSGAYSGPSQGPPPDAGAGNKGLFSKLTGKMGGRPPQGYGQAPPNQYGGYPPQGYPPQGYPPQGYPPQGYPPQQYGGYAPQPQVVQKQKHSGMGALGGAGLGLGAGLLGGALIGEAMDGHDGGHYGGDDGGYGGDDGGYGGGDDGGFGGDDGGGDFGGD